MKMIFIFLLGLFAFKGYSQKKEINRELNFTLKFVVENDTIAVNKEYSIIVNGEFPKDNSGHQGERKENFRKTNKKGNFKLFIINSGEYEFIVLGKGSVKKKIENIIDNKLYLSVENE